MRKIVEFDYDVGDQVKIVEIDRNGCVDGMALDNLGKQYRVIYWNDGTRNSTWLYPWEIKPAADEKNSDLKGLPRE